MTTRTRNRQQLAKRRAQRSFGDSLRAWLHDRELAAEKRRTLRKKLKPKGGRGVDRVPDRLRGLAVHPEWVHQHSGQPYVPYVNPERNKKPSAQRRLRKDLAQETGARP